jgi:hypothetical protein
MLMSATAAILAADRTWRLRQFSGRGRHLQSLPADAEAVAAEGKPAHIAQMRLEICRRDLADMIPDQCSCAK